MTDPNDNECHCNNPGEYLVHIYDADGNPIGGECTAKKDCTGGREWHTNSFTCEYREACIPGKETYDPDRERCILDTICDYPMYDL